MFKKTKKTGFLVFGIIAMLLMSALPVMAEPFSFQIFDDDTQQPVEADYITITDASGNLRGTKQNEAIGGWSSLEPGNYILTVQDADYLTWSNTVTVPSFSPEYVYLTPSGSGSGDNDDGGLTPAGDLLDISNVDFEDEVKPGFEDWDITVEVDNDLGYKAEDVEIEVTVEGIDGDKDLSDETSRFSLSDGDDKEKTLSFDIPLDAEDGNYDVLVEVTWKDNLGQRLSAQDTYTLDVEREEHEVAIEKVTLSTLSVMPGEPVEIAVKVVNIGLNDETVVVKAVASDVGIEEALGQFDLEQDDDKTVYLPVNIPSSAKPGKYFLYIYASYEHGTESDTETVILDIASSSLSPSGEQVSVTPLTMLPQDAMDYTQAGMNDQYGSGVDAGTILAVLALLAVIVLIGKDYFLKQKK